jgi:hypothetical protein
MNLVLERDKSSQYSTIGELFIDGKFQCFTLEDVVREVKVPGQTAIPAGIYRIVVTWSPHFMTFLPLLVQVPGFSGVRIHPGNKPSDTEGCILLGKEAGQDVVLHSKTAFSELFPLIEEAEKKGEHIFIRIEDFPETNV